MAKYTPGKAQGKVGKPYPDFPLFPHGSGYWAKKVRGRLVYFGKVADDPKGEAALERWLDQRDDLLAGRTPRVKAGGLTMADLVNVFLTRKRERVATGELTERSWSDYHRASGRAVAVFGKNRLASDLAADDFALLRQSLAKTLGPVALGSEIQRIRVLFKFGYDEGLLDRPVRYGQGFARPSRKILRKARHASGPRLFTAEEIRRMIDAAGRPLRAMIHLGINCGYGNSDCASLPKSAVDLDGGWVDYPRPKTGVKRRCPLWPETVAALQAALDARPTPRDKANQSLVFITKRGLTWGKDTSDNPISNETRKLLDKLGITGTGRTFYALRHVFQTIGDGARDPIATRFIMGHAESGSDMSAVYREDVDDARLVAVAERVREWLFGEDAWGGKVDQRYP